jgi:transcriptional regulator with XRE-family HTH domain
MTTKNCYVCDEVMDSVRKNLRSYRIALGMSQSDLARRAKVYKEDISRWETGKNRMEIRYLSALSRAMHMTERELIVGLSPSRLFAWSIGL